MDTIAFYVHETGLLKYFIEPICSFLFYNYKIIVFHLGKRDSKTPLRSAYYELIDVGDISVKEIGALIEKHNPKAVVFLGFVSIFELLMLRIVKKNNHKAIYLQHGIFSKNTISFPFQRIINSFSEVLRRNLYFLGCYFSFILYSNQIKKECVIFYNCLRRKKYNDTRFDKAIFFSKHGYSNINPSFGYNEEDVFLSGYPLAFSNDEFETYTNVALKKCTHSKKAIYIHQPFIADGLVKWSYEDEKVFILSIANDLELSGLKLEVLLHPRESFKNYENKYKGTSIRIIQNIQKENYASYALAIGHYSSALLYPLFFHIPIRIMNYDTIDCHNDNIFENSIDEKNFDKYIFEYLGSGKYSFENVADTVRKVLMSLN